jgi:hypothetical protein
MLLMLGWAAYSRTLLVEIDGYFRFFILISANKGV